MDEQAKKKMRNKRLGSDNPNWKGGESIDSNGYVTVPNGSKGGGRDYEHRVKTHAKRGVPVHHKNHNRADNSPDNLEPKKNHPRPSMKYWRKGLSDL